ncbi:PAS domain S-box protein [Halobellus sp. GM3]|uniref:PAS domain S-box protein n=1 Tax=Halobellus sp. GM3 TaxID=3458410 RepID=UPI00403DF7B2
MQSPTVSDVRVLAVTVTERFAAEVARGFSTVADAGVTTVDTVEAALAALDDDVAPECVVCEQPHATADAVAFLGAVRARRPSIPVFFFVEGFDTAQTARAIALGATDCFDRPDSDERWERVAMLAADAVAYYRARGGVAGPTGRAEALFDSAEEAVAVLRDDRFVYLNEAGHASLGIDRPEAGSDDVADREGTVDRLITRRLDAPHAEQFAAVRRGEQWFVSGEAHLLGSDGYVTPVEFAAARTEWAGVDSTLFVAADRDDNRTHGVPPSEARSRSDPPYCGATSGPARTTDDIPNTAENIRSRAMDEAPIGITIADATQPDNPLIYANDTFGEITGYPRSETLSRNSRFLQGEETDPETVATLREAIDDAEPITVGLWNYRRDGTPFWNRVTVAPVRNDDGEVVNYVGFQRDVTASKARHEQFRRFQRAVEAAGHAIYITDPEGTITYVNPAFERITGYDREEAVGETPRILHSGEMSADYYDRLWSTISAGAIWEEEIRDRRRSGALYVAHQTIAPLVEDGDIEAYVAIQTDISEQKRREKQLLQYERAIEGLDELIAAVDSEYRYRFANPAYREFHGLGDDLAGETLPAVIGPDRFETIRPYVERAFAGQAVQYRMTRTRENKPDRTFDVRYHPLEDPDGDGVRTVVSTMRDLTEQLEREQQLAALDRLLRHNLRNELNIVQGRAELIKTRSSGDLAAMAEAIEDAAGRILTQAEKGREIVTVLTQPSSPTRLDVEAMVRETVADLEAAFPRATISVDIESPLRLTTLPEVERAVYELLENAIEHAEKDSPQIRVTAGYADETVEISVADDGPGIPADERAVLSEDASIGPLQHSSGMGLWLVKRILTRAGGTVRFEDAEDGGSVVTLIVPLGGQSTRT